MPRHPSTAYLPARRLRLRRKPFRTATLNVVGWRAVAGLCGAGAAIGLATARLTGASTWIVAPAGGAAAFVSLIAVDRRKWAGMSTGYSWTDDLAETRRMADLLTRAGVAASVETREYERPPPPRY